MKILSSKVENDRFGHEVAGLITELTDQIGAICPQIPRP
jgi:hypothetical protein